MAKYSRFKTKIHPLTYVIGLILVALVAVVIIFSVPSEKQKIYNEYYQKQIRTEQMTQEQLIDKDHVYKNITVSQLESKIDSKELVVVYIGGNWCPVCVKEVGIYSSEFKKNEELLAAAKNIFYLKKHQDKDIKGLEQLAEKLEFDNPKSYPTLLSFYDGKLIDVKYTAGAEDAKTIKTNVLLYFDQVLQATK